MLENLISVFDWSYVTWGLLCDLVGVIGVAFTQPHLVAKPSGETIIGGSEHGWHRCFWILIVLGFLLQFVGSLMP